MFGHGFFHLNIAILSYRWFLSSHIRVYFMSSRGEAVSIYKQLCTHICVFCADSAREYVYHLWYRFADAQTTFPSIAMVLTLRKVLLSASIVAFLRRLLHWWSPPHFWAKFFFSFHLFDQHWVVFYSLGWWASMWSFSWLLCILVVVNWVSLGYQVKHKSYLCWDTIGSRMQVSRDVSFG